MRDRIEQLRQQLQSQAEPALVWYRQREPREQLALRVLGVFVGLSLIYLLLWKPVADSYHSALDLYSHQYGVLTWVQSNAGIIREQRGDSAQGGASSGNWINTINTSASQAGLSLRGFTPDGQDAVQVSLEDQEFTAVLAWLQDLEVNQGVRVSHIDMSGGQQPGTVTVRATLRR